MAMTVHTAGVTTVQIKALYNGAGSGLLDLGQTRNYAEVTKEAFFLDVPGDANGGDDGPPIEIQYLGEIARIRVELTKYDTTTADIVRARVTGSTAGTYTGTGNVVGKKMFDVVSSGTPDPRTMRVLLSNANDDRNFNRCIPRMPIEIGRGTKYSTLICEFEAHKDVNGILYNADVNGDTNPS